MEALWDAGIIMDPKVKGEQQLQVVPPTPHLPHQNMNTAISKGKSEVGELE